jgi:hypothetical protein
MTRLVRTIICLTIACALSLSYCLFNLKHLARNIGYDEVYYFHWVDNWKKDQVYYPQHLLFAPSSVLFQKGFITLTGITNTAFIQRFKNILFVSIGLSAFFLLFYVHSKRILLSLSVAVLIGISGSLWGDALQNETSAIPGVLINLVMFCLVFYRRSQKPALFIVVFSVFNSLAILLHQAYLFTVPLVALMLLFSMPDKDAQPRVRRNIGRTFLYLFLVTCFVGGTYFYIGFVKLNLRLKDNPEGAQQYLGVPIHGNFMRYFYLIQAYGKWGKTQPEMVRLGVNGYLSSFVTTVRADQADLQDPLGKTHFSANVTLALLTFFFLGFILFFVPMFRRYGVLYPVLLLWFAAGSLFIFWWEPAYIEHWIYVTILTLVLGFMMMTTILSQIRQFMPRTKVYAAMCVVLWSFGAVAYQDNFTHTILAQEKLWLPVSAQSPAWNDEYRMDSIYRTP